MRANSVPLAVALLGSVLAFTGTAEAGPLSAAPFEPLTTGSLPDEQALRPTFAEPGVRPAPQRPSEDARAAPVWCGNGRIVGSGVGFCELN
ncbi:hypothetical protein [Methylobacterium gossipiicola]|uniref:Porin n=1 Tax=Methylobacterium gossipiicola TaxID=582675 RepID=A0A1I2RMI0_9HYPH|nr:hypothetical protein [Methylobacterium gossipiicola]SFG41660.1 hypothetical protein SAMN05192565_1032 [Methylobacterium gossipiicola]